MQFHEMLHVPEQCAQCPILEAMQVRHDRVEAGVQELIGAIMDGTIRESLLADLVGNGRTPTEAREFLEDRCADIHKLNTQAVAEQDEQKDVIVSLAQKVIAYCGETGAMTLHGQQDGQNAVVTICMSQVLNLVGEDRIARIRRKMVD